MLTVRTDNVATLAMVARMQPHSAQLGIVARELALDIAYACYSPDVVEHIPGITNSGADALSRRYAPDAYPLPAYLHTAKECIVSSRGHGWWKSRPAPLKSGVGAAISGRISPKAKTVQY